MLYGIILILLATLIFLDLNFDKTDDFFIVYYNGLNRERKRILIPR